MSSLFLVTSAIYTSYGKVSTDDRIKQTKETLNSIQKYAPQSSVILLDCGEKSINKNLFDCDIIDYTKHSEIQSHRTEFLTSTKDTKPEIILKSMLEIMMIGECLKKIDGFKYERIFKLNGRYKLNSKFNYKTHLDAKDKVVILSPFLSGCLYRKDVGPTMFMYSTRCWSFDIKLLSNIIITYDKMKKDILYLAKTEKQGDIEHLFYKHLNKKIVCCVDQMGVEGYWAPDGNLIDE